MTLPELITALRERLGWTKVALGKALATDPSAITAWEGGYRVPRWQWCEAMAALDEDPAATRDALEAAYPWTKDGTWARGVLLAVVSEPRVWNVHTLSVDMLASLSAVRSACRYLRRHDLIEDGDVLTPTDRGALHVEVITGRRAAA